MFLIHIFVQYLILLVRTTSQNIYNGLKLGQSIFEFRLAMYYTWSCTNICHKDNGISRFKGREKKKTKKISNYSCTRIYSSFRWSVLRYGKLSCKKYTLSRLAKCNTVVSWAILCQETYFVILFPSLYFFFKRIIF